METTVSGSGNRNPSVSCGCWNEDSLSGGEIAGIVIGVLAFLAIVATLLAIYFKRICRYKSQEIPSHGSVKECVTGCCSGMGRKSNKGDVPIIIDVPINNMGEVWASVKPVEVSPPLPRRSGIPPPLPRRSGVPPPLPPRDPVNPV